MKKYVFLSLLTLASIGLVSSASADTFGDQRDFFVNEKYDRTGRTSLSASLKVISTHAYFYVDDTYWNTLTEIQRTTLTKSIEELSQEFDTRIYPLVTQQLGNEHTPGIDNDPRITVLLENLVDGNGGYFDSIHGYPRVYAKNSNEREMISIAVQSVGGSFGKVFLAHEFQHLVSFYQKDLVYDISEDVWLNELRSESVSSLLGYHLGLRSVLRQRLDTFLKNPTDSVTEWVNVPSDYASVTLFGEYLIGRYGRSILSDSLHSLGTGIASLEQAIRRAGHTETFADVFLDWMIASYLNRPDVNPAYGYHTEGLESLQVRPQTRVPLNFGDQLLFTSASKPWQPRWFEFSISDQSTRAVRFEFSADPIQGPLATYLISYTDGTVDVGRVTFVNGKRTLYIQNPNFVETTKKIEKVTVMSTYGGKKTGFGSAEPSFDFSLQVSLVNETEFAQAKEAPSSLTAFFPEVALLKNGALIRRNNNEGDIYVIEGSYKRYLNPTVIALYGHLVGVQPFRLDDALFNTYTSANYVRNANDKKVYAVWPDGTKHWLNMSAQYFTESGRDWNAIFVINDAELATYKTGPDITR